jgi:N-acetylglucosaminyl-diphospho-decaprenol L-rhamnosyltransferase
MIDLSILIVNWNTRELLQQCLQSIYATTNAVAIEVVVVDNASSDGSIAMLRNCFASVKIIENRENVGFARANNQAIRQAHGRYVLLLNSDTILPEGVLTALVRQGDDRPKVGVIGCMLRNRDGTFQASYNDFPSIFKEWLVAAGLAAKLIRPQFPSHAEKESQETRLVDWVPGAALFARTSALAEIGGLDESYFMYTEETDLCWRVRQAGWDVLYYPGAQIVHLGGGSANRRTPTQVKLLYGSKATFFRKHRGTHIAGLYRVGVRCITLVKIGIWICLRSTAGRDRRSVLAEKIRAHKLLVGGRW